jgi:acyl carrier protein
MDDTIRGIIRTYAQIDSSPESLTSTADLYAAGMTSQATVNVMLALEDAFDVEFPDHMLKRSVFESIDSIRSALAELSGEAAA